MSECITHHFACDCREKKFSETEVKLKVATEALEFYANKENWNTYLGGETDYAMIKHDQEELFWSSGIKLYDDLYNPTKYVGGSKARQALKIIKGE